MHEEDQYEERVRELEGFLEAGLRDQHPDWVKAYGEIAARAVERNKGDQETIKGLRAYPELADRLVTTPTDKIALDAMIADIFMAIAVAESGAERYRTHEVPAAMLAALAHLYPTPQQRQPTR